MTELQQEADLTGDERLYLPYAWRLLGGDVQDSLPVTELGRILRGFGKNPSEQEILYLKYDQGLQDNGRLVYDDAVKLYIKCKTRVYTPEKMVAAFRVLDEEKAEKITSKDLRELLTKLGEPLSNYEVDQLLLEVEVKQTSVINYKDLSQVLMSDNRPYSRS